MAPKRIKIGIALDPRLVQVVGERNKTVEQVQGTLRFTEVRIGTRCVVESKQIVGIVLAVVSPLPVAAAESELATPIGGKDTI